ncbi:uncharacterized protein Dyak_GE29138 [Drosophila yakuba]|uniref:Reverse transcriptase domain-containing protein n=1 Tax=Drosophila yakuba TaxID=7245 RepID=A0A0R1E864_DROYA|nr:uncharacterized protein Dyak_GE29138 [Drosophila yakuba]
MPDDTFLVGYADDIVAVITARNTEYAQHKLTQVMTRVKKWLNSHDLKLADEKSELLLVTRKRIPLEIDMRVGENVIRTRKDIKYLGVRLDSKLTFSSHIQETRKRATVTTKSLSRLMANVGGPLQSRRKLLMEVSNAIMLYGCEVWAGTLETACRSKPLLEVQRTMALRIASAHRTVSGPAASVIGGAIPIDLIAKERKRIYEIRQARETTRALIARSRDETLQQWQEIWAAEEKGRWTARLIPNLVAWTARAHGEVNYYITQMLTGHGYFGAFLHSIGKRNDARCEYGDAEMDNEHTIFQCGKFGSAR